MSVFSARPRHPPFPHAAHTGRLASPPHSKPRHACTLCTGLTAAVKSLLQLYRRHIPHPLGPSVSFHHTLNVSLQRAAVTPPFPHATLVHRPSRIPTTPVLQINPQTLLAISYNVHTPLIDIHDMPKNACAGGDFWGVSFFCEGRKLAAVVAETKWPDEAQADGVLVQSRVVHLAPHFNADTGYQAPSGISFSWAGPSIASGGQGNITASLRSERTPTILLTNQQRPRRPRHRNRRNRRRQEEQDVEELVTPPPAPPYQAQENPIVHPNPPPALPRFREPSIVILDSDPSIQTVEDHPSVFDRSPTPRPIIRIPRPTLRSLSPDHVDTRLAIRTAGPPYPARGPYQQNTSTLTGWVINRESQRVERYFWSDRHLDGASPLEVISLSEAEESEDWTVKRALQNYRRHALLIRSEIVLTNSLHNIITARIFNHDIQRQYFRLYTDALELRLEIQQVADSIRFLPGNNRFIFIPTYQSLLLQDAQRRQDSAED
ncbi:hypothetical protein FIBSPDRAFT_954965 [Athelia psychrophila]|uniref:Uncharacterized protein n=1 Tax=Athelia psychrophila TaxID=1759441 RepID=A0A166IJQ0_9AGAM|nr:hypothetical protein FIBSPDRAFT_954965 [Fibularhizoctonia sp. CBS 109695]